MRVLVAGCGYVGAELGGRLGRSGHEVWGLRRDPSGLPPPIRGVRADLTAARDLSALASGQLDRERGGSEDADPGRSPASFLSGIDRVVYAAAPDDSTPAAYRATYVEGARNLLDALITTAPPVRRFLFVSSTAVWGDAGGGWVDETIPTSPDDFRGEILLEAESLVRAAPFPSTVLRLGGIYGPGRTRLIERVHDGEARCPEGAVVWSNRVHRDDASEMIRHLLEMESPEPVYLGVDDEPAPLCDVYRYVSGLLGVPPPEPGVGGGGRSNKRCSNRRIRESGVRLGYPTYREGYRDVIARARSRAGS